MRRLIAGQQQDGPLVRQAQRPLQRREDFEELFPESVDLAGSVVDEVGAASDQDLEVDGYLVAGPQLAQVLAHAGLVGDDEGVLRVRLALAAVGGRCLVHRKAGEVDHRLVVADQQAEEQGGPTVVDVHRPQRVLGECEYVADQLQQRGLVVQDSPRQEAFALRVDHHAVVIFLADVHPGPDMGHGHLRQLVVTQQPSRRPRRRCPTQRSSRVSQLAVESSRGPGRPSSLSHQTATSSQPYPKPLGPAILRMTASDPRLEGRTS